MCFHTENGFVNVFPYRESTGNHVLHIDTTTNEPIPFTHNAIRLMIQGSSYTFNKLVISFVFNLNHATSESISN